MSKKNVEIKDGDFVYIDYTSRIKENNQLLDTTISEIAEKEDFKPENHELTPQLVVIGNIRDFVRGFEPRIKGAVVGKKITFDVPPEEAYGLRRRELIESKNIREFRRQGVHPKVGQTIQMQERSGSVRVGLVRRIGSGRVLIDYNDPRAEKTINFEVTVKEKVTSDKEKMESLLARRIGTEISEKFKLDFKAGVLNIIVPKEAFYVEKLYLIKVLLSTEYFKFIPKIKKIVYTETHEAPKIDTPKKTTKKKAATKKAAPKKKTTTKKPAAKKKPTKKK
ncbi:MAG: FKBP-type peptidyl-prolyl cis-trans isomerase [Candidatus Ranarchaeia archaeon]